jgi:hypothetical protein
MQRCPQCNESLEGSARSCCGHCGFDIHAEREPWQQRLIEQSPETNDVVAAVVSAPAPRARSRQKTALIASACALAFLGALIAMGRARSESPVSLAPAPERAAAEIVSAAAAPAIEAAAPAPTWVGSTRAARQRDGSRFVSFQLAALRDVPVWMTNVRPVLVARCLSRRTEVFLSIGSAVSVESGSDDHNVQVQFDDEAPVVQRWAGSVSYQELMAPNGVAFARRLARTQTLRLGFTPYNSEPVFADFNVGGFDRVVGSLASTCGWRLEQ